MARQGKSLLLIAACLLAASIAAREEDRGTIYSPAGKRDPFRQPPLTSVGREVAAVSPLERYPLDKMQLRAILNTDGRPQAMLEDPEGKTFIVAAGDIIGRERAIVSRILNTEVIVTERTFNYLGVENLFERVLSLPPDQGELAEAALENGGSRGVAGGKNQVGKGKQP